MRADILTVLRMMGLTRRGAQLDSVNEMGCPQAARAEDAGANPALPKALRLAAR
jgi:hypothetical protein